MKHLLTAILLFITNCTDNKKEQETMIEVNTNTISQETNTPPEPPISIELSYSNSLNIILVESTFKKSYNCVDMTCWYNAIYWNSNDNVYYAVTNTKLFWEPIPVTNINTNFIYTIDTNKQHEPVFDSKYQEIFTNTGAYLLYIGDLSSPLERVYLDPTNQIYYIKKLESFDTSIYEEMTYTNDGEYNHPYKMITNHTTPIYPAMLEKWSSVVYTNENQQIFGSMSYAIESPYELKYPPILYYSSGDLIIVNK